MSCCRSSSCCGSSSGADGLLKFSGLVGTDEGGGSLVSYLADAGFTALVNTAGIFYPVPLTRTLQGLSVKIGVTLSPGQSILVELLKNGTAIPGFSVIFGDGDTGTKTNENTGRATFAPGDNFALRVTTVGFSGSTIAMTAGVGTV